MSSDTYVPEGQMLVTDKTVKLSCGCLAIYMLGDLDNGRMFFCKRHLRVDPFDQLRMLAEVTRQIKSGAIRIELEVL